MKLKHFIEGLEHAIEQNPDLEQAQVVFAHGDGKDGVFAASKIELPPSTGWYDKEAGTITLTNSKHFNPDTMDPAGAITVN